MDPISVVVRRGGVVEAVHRVHAVATRDGETLAARGDVGRVWLMRSSAKPFQALPLARARDDVAEEELAIASASHLARPEQLAAVERLLERAGATEDDLECGPEHGSRLRHNCSGKHAGMLALCAARGWERRGYRLADHPVQRACREEMREAAEVAELDEAVDGCGVVTFGLPLERMAHAFSRLEQREAGPRVAAAMRAFPEHIRGPRAADTMLMHALDGWTAKGGAEGLHCACGPDGIGIALKVEDGNMRAMEPALAEFLAPLGYELPDFERVALTNSRDEVVGEIAVGSRP